MENKEFLKTYFVDCQSEMRWRRDSGHRMMNLAIGLYTSIIPVSALLTRFLSKSELIFSLTALIIMIAVVTTFIDKKIRAEHEIYKTLGAIVVKIWSAFGLFDEQTFWESSSGSTEMVSLLSNESKNYGKGPGYKSNLKIIWACAIITMLFLLSLLAVNYFDKQIGFYYIFANC